MAMMAPASPWEGRERIDRFVELAVELIIKIGHGSGRSVRSHPVTFLGRGLCQISVWLAARLPERARDSET